LPGLPQDLRGGRRRCRRRADLQLRTLGGALTPAGIVQSQLLLPQDIQR